MRVDLAEVVRPTTGVALVARLAEGGDRPALLSGDEVQV